jgi:secondary thiamine-phosphate synthase enzyme
MIFRDVIELDTESGKFYDVTEQIRDVVKQCAIREGTCNLFLTATTAGLLLNEYDRMLMADFLKAHELLTPEDKFYHHPENAHSHIRASLLNQSLTFPVANGDLALGDWQSILLWEFDVKPRSRKIIITISD